MSNEQIPPRTTIGLELMQTRIKEYERTIERLTRALMSASADVAASYKMLREANDEHEALKRDYEITFKALKHSVAGRHDNTKSIDENDVSPSFLMTAGEERKVSISYRGGTGEGGITKIVMQTYTPGKGWLPHIGI